MKASKFNIYFEENNATYIYNTFSTGFIKLNREKFKNFKLCADNNDFSEYSDAEKCMLYDNGFIVDKAINEIEQVRFRYLRGVFNNRDFRVTIVPTLNCNFNCPYCFEREKREENITENDCVEIRSFINEQMLLSQPVEFGIAWYGGEPLLKVNIIEILSNDVNELCNKNNIRRADDSIVTNGYLLDEKVAYKLYNIGVKKIQITLDGNRESHDKLRVLKNGLGTFDKIIESIQIAQDVFDVVTVRFNTNMSNYKGIVQLLNENSSIFNKKNTLISVGRLKSYLGGNVDKDNDVDCFNGTELQKIQSHIDNYYKDNNSVTCIPVQIKHTNCGAESHKCFIIGPNKRLYKCAEALGVNDSVGIIKDGKFIPNSVYWQWFKFNIFDNNEKCLECIYVPMCMGGCPSSRRRLGIPNNEICGYWEQWLKIKFKEYINTL